MAQLTIGTIFDAIDRVSGPVRRITQNVQKFASETKSSTSSLSSAFGGLKGVLGGLGVALSVGAIGKSISEFAKLGDEIAKTSSRLNVGSSALQELRHAAGLSGVAAGSVETALGSLNKGLGQLQNGYGRVTTAMEKINPALGAQLKNAKSTDEAFDIAIAGLSKMENSFERTAAASALFGGAGEQMLHFAKAGPEELAKMRQEFKDLGGVLDENSTGAGELFGDTMERIGVILTGLKNTVLGPLLTALNPLLVAFQNWMQANRAVIATNLTGFVQGLIPVVGGLFTAIGTIIEAVLKINDIFGGLLIPLILGGVVAFYAITGAIAAYNAVLTFMAATKLAAATAGGILNAVLYANPIGIIVLAVVALIAVVILLVKNWDVVSKFFADLWVKIKQYFFVALEFIKNLFLNYHPLGLIIKHWRPIVGFFSALWNSVKGIFTSVWSYIGSIIDRITGKVGAIVGMAKRIGSSIGGLFSGSGGGGGAPVSPNTTSIQRNESRVDVNLNNLPQGTAVRQSGSAPNVRLNMGYAGG